MTEKEFGLRKNESLEITEPSAWELIRFLISRLPDKKILELSEKEDDLFNLVLAVKTESGKNMENIKEIEAVADNLNAVARLGQMLTSPLTIKQIAQRWMLDSNKKDQAKKKIN